MIYAGPLLDIGASSLQFEAMSGSDLTVSTSVDPLIVTIEQQQVSLAGDEVNVADEGQSIDDMPQNQLKSVPITQSEDLVEDSKDRTVDDEPLSDNMLWVPQEENIFNISASQQPSNLESLNFSGQEGANLCTDSPIHILGISAVIPDPSLPDSAHADPTSLVEVSVVLG